MKVWLDGSELRVKLKSRWPHAQVYCNTGGVYSPIFQGMELEDGQWLKIHCGASPDGWISSRNLIETYSTSFSPGPRTEAIRVGLLTKDMFGNSRVVWSGIVKISRK